MERAISRDRPFADRLRLQRLEPIAEEGAHSGTAFRVYDAEGRRYKLRVCARERQAREIERCVGVLPELFPALLARDRSYLLFEYLADHAQLTRRELLDAAERLGALSAQLHAAGERAGLVHPWAQRWVSLRQRLQFRRDLWLLRRRGTVSARVVAGARAKFAARRRVFGLPIALELDDVHKGNLMRDPEDVRLRYVDEEGVGLRPRGLALATLLKTATYSTPIEAFRAGYASVADAAWIEPAYLEYLLLIDSVRRVAHKVRHERRLEKLPRELAGIRAMAGTPDVSLDWRFPRDAVQARRAAVRKMARMAMAAGHRVEIPEEDRPTPKDEQDS